MNLKGFEEKTFLVLVKLDIGWKMNEPQCVAMAKQTSKD